MPDGIDLILADHERVNALFAEFAASGDTTVVGQIIDALAAHDDAEQAALYPLLRATVGDGAMLNRAEAAHSAVKQQVDLIKSLEGPPLSDAVSTLQRLVTAHVRDEEERMLPALRAAATAAQLAGLAARIGQVKQRVG